MSQPDWMKKEDNRASKQAGKGQEVANPTAPRLVKEKKIAPSTPKIERTLKGFRVDKNLIAKFDVLVAEQKTKSGKNGPTLIDEALELLFTKYKKS